MAFSFDKKRKRGRKTMEKQKLTTVNYKQLKSKQLFGFFFFFFSIINTIGSGKQNVRKVIPIDVIRLLTRSILL